MLHCPVGVDLVRILRKGLVYAYPSLPGWATLLIRCVASWEKNRYVQGTYRGTDRGDWTVGSAKKT